LCSMGGAAHQKKTVYTWIRNHLSNQIEIKPTVKWPSAYRNGLK
jgi:hypothetical protein